METVTIGCRLPNGLTLEVGYKVSHERSGGAPFARYVKGKDYATFTLKGTNQHLIIRGPDGRPFATAPNQRNREPFINENVPKDLWDRWVKEHQDSPLLASGQLFVVPKNDPNTVKAAGLDARAKGSAIFEPLEQGATMKIEDHTIASRKDEE